MEKVSFVIPCYRSEKTIETVVKEICSTMDAMSKRYHYEIILIDDCSPDGTYEEIRKLAGSYRNVFGASLAKNFGQHSALMAGFHLISGDIVVCLDDDGQTPANEVGKLLDKINEGFDVVYARYEHKHHSAFRNLGSKVNSLMAETMLGKPRELFLSSYFAARRFVIEEMKRYDGAFPYVIGLILRSTKRIANVTVEHRDRTCGVSGYSIGKLLGLWLNGFTSFSVKPLRAASYVGAISAFLGLCYLVYVIALRIFVNSAPAGWSTLIGIMLILGGLIMLMLGLIGEYVGRIYMCINNTPQYLIRDQVRSSDEDGIIDEKGNT